MTAAERPVLAVSTAVFRDGKVLLARRGAKPSIGLWTLPGGRVEPGETLAIAAAREVMEEVGVDCAIIGVAGAIDVIQNNPDGTLKAHYVVVSHAANWVAFEPTTGPEAAEVGWFEPHAIPSTETTPGLQPIIDAAAKIALAAQPIP